MPQLLSKSKYLSGLQCLRYLWVIFNDPKRIPETDPVTQHIFDQGHVVGELAKKLFPDGIDIPQDDFTENINLTASLLKERKPLFETGILAGNVYSRIDILYPVNVDEWDIVEVKSSTSVKDVHIQDVAYQRYCCTKQGLNIRRCFLALINNQYVKNGDIDPEGLFNIHEITDEVEAISGDIPRQVEEMFEVINQEACPEMAIGPHCHDPYDCPLTECWDGLPEDNVFTLYYGGKKAFEMYNSGIISIKDIPDGYKLNEKQIIQKESFKSGEPYLDKEAVRDFLSSLEYPLYYLDFETIGPAVPLFDGTRPYQAVPFQFSLHVVKDEESKPKHFSFLASCTGDPRPAFLTELKKVIGNSGSIVVYNQGFEGGVLKELAIAFPEYDSWITQVCSRLVDLLRPFSKFYYYHPAQKGSASLKSVLPALTGKSYEGMGIADGQEASVAFQAVTYGDVSKEERNKVRADLEKYCSLDTEGMIWIVERLEKLCDEIRQDRGG